MLDSFALAPRPMKVPLAYSITEIRNPVPVVDDGSSEVTYIVSGVDGPGLSMSSIACGIAPSALELSGAVLICERSPGASSTVIRNKKPTNLLLILNCTHLCEYNRSIQFGNPALLPVQSLIFTDEAFLNTTDWIDM